MAPRDPSLPEGTDHIIDTNIDIGDAGGSAGGGGGTGASGSGGASTGTGTSAGGGAAGSAFQFDKQNGDNGKSGTISKAADGIMSQVRDQVSTFRSQAGDRARSMADDGKRQATDFLQTIAQVVADAAGSVEDRLGGQYAGVGRRASDSIQSLASSLDERSVDDLIDDATSFVRRSPAVAIGVAAIVGFAVARVVRSSVAEFSSSGTDGTTTGGTGGTGSTTGGGTTGGASVGAMGSGASGGLNATSGAFGETGAGTAGNIGGAGGTSTGPGSTGGTGNAPTI